MKDASIVTIYDLENEGAPLECHRIDAKEFLQSPRWSTSPDKKAAVKAAAPKVKAKVEEEPDELTVAEIKEALAKKKIEIPPHVTLKADLQALLDGE